MTSRRKVHKLKCGTCAAVLHFSFPSRAQPVDCEPDLVASFSRDEKAKSVPRLHRLMGDSLARDLLLRRGFGELQGCFLSFPDLRLLRSEYKAAVLRGKWAIIITTTITMKVLVHMMIPSWPAVAAHAFW
ncbi:unnamed protein product [Musa acuminata var. zebrina]